MPKVSLKRGQEIPPPLAIAVVAVALVIIVASYLYGTTPHGKEPMPPASPYGNLVPGQISTVAGGKPFVPGTHVSASQSAAPPGLGPPAALMPGNGQAQNNVNVPSGSTLRGR